MTRRHLARGWRTGLPRLVACAGGEWVNFFGYSLIVPFEIISLPIPARADPLRSRRSVSSQRAHLLHARDAIDAVLDYTKDGRDAFFADRKS